MKEFKGAKGGWELSNNFKEIGKEYAPSFIITTNNSRVIPVNFTSKHYYDDKEDYEEAYSVAEANAKLISAAPELLEAVQFFLRTFEPEKSYMRGEFEKAKEAIKKATK